MNLSSLWAFVTRQKVLLTLVYCGSFLCLGLLVAGLGPSLPTLGRNTHSPDQRMGATVTSRALGYLAGSTSGPVFHRLPGNKMVATSLVVTCIVCFLIPHITSFALMCTLFAFQGISMGMLDAGCNLMTLWLHQENCDPYIQALHAAFAIGAVISPAIIKAFLSAHEPLNWAWYGIGSAFVPIIALLIYFPSPSEPKEGETSGGDQDSSSSSGDEFPQIHELDVAGVKNKKSKIGGGGGGGGGESTSNEYELDEDALSRASSPTPMLPLHASSHTASDTADDVVSPTATVPSALQDLEKRPHSPSSSGASEPPMFAFSWENRYSVDYKPYLTVLGVALFLCFYVGGEVATGSFTTTFALRRGLTTEDGGAFLTFLFWLTFAFGRLIAIPLSLFISPKLMLTVDLIGTFISVLLIWNFSNSAVGLGISLFVYGLFMASTFPTAITLLQTIMPVTGNMTTVFVVGASLGEMLVPLLVSANFEITHYMSLVYVQFGSVVTGIITMIGVAIWGHLILKQKELRKRLEEKVDTIRVGAGDTMEKANSATTTTHTTTPYADMTDGDEDNSNTHVVRLEF